jgi:NAD(P)-dependent dehydrogenase (short-subunit alcohol dehydrogenase family)
MGRLDGKVALVTGAAQGIGKAIAERFAKERCIVVASDMKMPPGGKLSGEIEFHMLDVTQPDDWSRVVAAVLAKHKRVDILVNNAGIVFSYAPIHETSLEDWDKVVGVNQKGTFLGMRAVVPAMMRQHAGSIINISSIWGVVGAAGVAPYQAAKGAVRTMTKNAAITYAKDNIRANSIHPGIIWTPLIEAQDKAITDSLVADTPLGRLGQADEIANGALFLASDESSFVTGVELPIDGGILAK